jgi:hypothetical protein
MNKLVELFCDVDDFCKVFIPQWQKQLLENGTLKRQSSGRMTTSEIMKIVVIFHDFALQGFQKLLPYLCFSRLQRRLP